MRRAARAMRRAERTRAIGPRRGTLLRLLAAALVTFVAFAAGLSTPRAALAAFELRDASPAALGAVSIDLESESMFDAVGPRRSGIWLGASHASLYQVDGLVQDRAWGAIEGRRGSVTLAYARVGAPGTTESSARLTLRESGARLVALELDAERLELALDGEPGEGGWAFGGSARARVSFPRVDLEVAVAADRVLQSAGLDALEVPPSVPFSIRIRSGGAAAAWVDRWDGSGRRSPRLVLDVPIGGAARVRLGRGESPGRIGATLAIRWRRIEVSAGRMDQSAGGVITGAAVSLTPPAAAGGR